MLFLLATILLFQSCTNSNKDKPQTAGTSSTRCTGKKNCNICTDCSRCKHCHVNGGSCGVCR